MTMMSFICLLAVTILGTASAQIFTMGNCNPNLATVKNFDKTKFSGKWYELQRSFNDFEDGNKCTEWSFTLSTVEHVYDVNNTFVVDGEDRWETRYYPVNDDNLENGKMTIVPGIISDEQPIWVLDTDYENYAVTYSCLDSYEGKLEYIFVLSRTIDNRSSIAKAKQVLKDRNIGEKLMNIVHDCK